MTEILEKRESMWDKDKSNKIKTGDYIGFITGPTGDENVYIFLVKAELPPSMRPTHWATNTPYTEGNGVSAVNDREVVILTNKHSVPKQVEWNTIKKSTGLGGECTTWMPRGTQRIVKSHLLPFSIN